MTSSKPYLIRAMYQWVVDNNKTPYLLVDALQSGVVVPESFIENGRIVLNVSPVATYNTQLHDEHISFNARFSGQSMDVFIPVIAVLAVYAKENGQGMMFTDADNSGSPDRTEGAKPQPRRPSLKIVK